MEGREACCWLGTGDRGSGERKDIFKFHLAQ